MLPLSQPETSRSVNLTGMTYPIPNLCISQSLITELDMTPENSSTAPRRTVLITLRPCALHCNKEEDFLQMAHGKTVSNTAFPAALLFSNVILCYTGSGWGGINSLHSSPRGAMFWIYDQASAWQHNNVLAIPKQSLHSTKGFSLSLSDPLSTTQTRCGWTTGGEGTKMGQLTQTDLGDIPVHTMCHAQQ